MTTIRLALSETLRAMRRLRRDIRFSATIVLTVGIGIGAALATIRIAVSTVLAPLPYKDAGALYVVQLTTIGAPDADLAADYRVPLDVVNLWRNLDNPQLDVAEFRREWPGPIWTSERGSHRLRAITASANLLPLLGASPVLGHGFDHQDDQPGASPSVVLSHHFWAEHLGSDSAVVGRTLVLDHHTVQIVGVLPPVRTRLFSFDESNNVDIWLPLSRFISHSPGRLPYEVPDFEVVGRLRAGHTAQAANVQLTTVSARAASVAPFLRNRRPVLTGLRDFVVGDLRKPIAGLLLAVVFILMATCAGVTNMLLTRALSRRHDLVIRIALGASQRRAEAPLVADAVVLTGLGGLLSLFLAAGGIL